MHTTHDTWLWGADTPAANAGSDGCYYLDVTSNVYYGPKINGSWGVAWKLEEVKHNLSASKDPLTSDNGAEGYSEGSLWFNQVDRQYFIRSSNEWCRIPPVYFDVDGCEEVLPDPEPTPEPPTLKIGPSPRKSPEPKKGNPPMDNCMPHSSPVLPVVTTLRHETDGGRRRRGRDEDCHEGWSRKDEFLFRERGDRESDRDRGREFRDSDRDRDRGFREMEREVGRVSRENDRDVWMGFRSTDRDMAAGFAAAERDRCASDRDSRLFSALHGLSERACDNEVRLVGGLADLRGEVALAAERAKLDSERCKFEVERAKHQIESRVCEEGERTRDAIRRVEEKELEREARAEAFRIAELRNKLDFFEFRDRRRGDDDDRREGRREREVVREVREVRTEVPIPVIREPECRGRHRRCDDDDRRGGDNTGGIKDGINININERGAQFNDDDNNDSRRHRRHAE